ncbi:MAG: hypothetical protein GXO87_05915 [Chlorobi bacterium]|nr:hypothetical protein [Chlorobiota bacterium]
MKKLKSLFLYLIIVGLLSNTVFTRSLSSDEKINAFKKSVAAEEIANYSKAIDYMKVLYDDYKDDYLVNLRMGWLNYLNGNYNESEKYYHEAIRISNQSMESLFGLAYPLFAAGKIDELIDVYKTVLKIAPNSFRANLQLGQIYLGKKDYLNAKVLFEKTHNAFPSNFSSNLYLGWTYYYLGSSQKAHKLFTNALIAQPGEKSALEGYNLTK